jgi:GNAT superfamily N-acetyltransferase
VQLWGAVLPSARGSGVGQALYADGKQALEQGGARRACIEVREHHAAARAFFERRGFEVVMRYAVSRLDLTRFQADAHAATLQRVQAQGVEIVSARTLRAQLPDAITRINALRWAVVQDVPSADPPVAEPDASLARYLDTQPTALPDGWLVARIDGEFVGLSTLWRSLADPTVVHTGITGVVRGHRRRGIATALKVAAIDYARSIGARRIDTDNEENNPMYALNLAMGFEPQPAWLAYARDVPSSGAK